MRHEIYKMIFKTEVHFGNGRLSDTQATFQADTLFSALCHEALTLYGEKGINKLVGLCRNKKLLFSDGLPFIGDKLLIPKPVMEKRKTDEHDSVRKKNYKKLKYISVDNINAFMNQKLDMEKELELIKSLGRVSRRTQAAILEEDAMPYSIGTYRFHQGNGLYFIVGYKEDCDLQFVDELIYNLSYQGIGGRLSAGLGKFETRPSDKEISGLFAINATFFMNLSVSMAKDEELGNALDGATYILLRRGGFVQSFDYADTQLRKNDMYVFSAGSCFKNRFEGDIFDVSSGGSHAVYRYALPMFMGVM